MTARQKKAMIVENELGASLSLTKPVGFLEPKQAVDRVLREHGAPTV